MNDPQRSGGDATPENTRGAPTRRERAKRVRRERAHVSVRPSGATQESQSRRSVRWAIGVTIAVAVIGRFLLLFGKPIYKAWQGRKIPGLLAEARAKMEAGDLRGAHNLAAVAYQIDRSDTDANRVLATIHTVLGSDTAFYLWKNVENSGEATDEDLRNIARAYITQGYLPEAERLVNKLLEQDPEAKENLEIDAELNLARDDMQAAGMAISRILAANPDGFDKKISDAFAKLESPFQESRAAGWMVLFDVAEGGGDPGYNALRAILQKSEILPEDRVNQLRELLVATETARDRLWIEAMEWETKLAPERREEIYAEKLEECPGGAGQVFRLVQQLLYEQKEHRFLADKITLEDAIRNPLRRLQLPRHPAAQRQVGRDRRGAQFGAHRQHPGQPAAALSFVLCDLQGGCGQRERGQEFGGVPQSRRARALLPARAHAGEARRNRRPRGGRQRSLRARLEQSARAQRSVRHADRPRPAAARHDAHLEHRGRNGAPLPGARVGPHRLQLPQPHRRRPHRGRVRDLRPTAGARHAPR
ncbi:MAG: hypothetical protein R3F11_32115 [Verrucomicrobiales bacterium]